MNLEVIAERAGVSRMTVSRVLRNQRHVSEQTRKRVLQVVEEMGYRPNPMVSVLMSQVAQSRKADFQPTLAYAWEHKRILTPRELVEGRGGYFRDVKVRANELGFNVEPMLINNQGMSQKRFSDILKARNTPGIFLAPAEETQASYDFDWKAFAAVSFGYSIRKPALNRVCLNYHVGIFNAMQKLWDRGYRRFGLVLKKHTDERILHLWTSGFLTFHWERGLPLDGQNMLVQDEVDRQEYCEWFQACEPELIFSYDDWAYVPWCRELESRKRGRKKRPCAFIHLDKDFVQLRDELLGGLESCRPQMAAAAVDLLVSQIKQNQHGLPERQKTILMEPELVWFNE
ncbi:MAG: LacI family DNA-binding transcriptional regulator [Verrucomicrobiota bacterium JB024]|nr:LacI family DNA-binding transcriptional regulator [Verrucomicrobiota bacterium JB024]